MKKENNNYKIKYLFINLHDNDFYMNMCNFADLFIDLFMVGKLNISSLKDKIPFAFPRIMSSFNFLGKLNKENAKEQMIHLEEYFSKETTYLYDFEEIKKHIKEYNMEVDCKIEESNLYNEEERINNPGIWMNNLNLNMNAEVIWIQFVSDENDKPVAEHTTYIII